MQDGYFFFFVFVSMCVFSISFFFFFAACQCVSAALARSRAPRSFSFEPQVAFHLFSAGAPDCEQTFTFDKSDAQHRAGGGRRSRRRGRNYQGTRYLTHVVSERTSDISHEDAFVIKTIEGLKFLSF